MTRKNIQMDGTTYTFHVTDTVWELEFPHSQTKVKHAGQLDLMKEASPYMVPAEFEDREDVFVFRYDTEDKQTWTDIQKMERKDKLRALLNISRFQELLHTRYTFFLHPDNIVFDFNHVPYLVHRGIRDILPPYMNKEEDFFKQFQCLAVSMFSKKYTYDELLTGSLKNAKASNFERMVAGAANIEELLQIVEENYAKEMAYVQHKMKWVSKKKFRMFKGLSIGFIIAAVVLAVPLGYFAFMKVPYQNDLLAANEHFLKGDYEKVITALKDENPQKLPQTTLYELAYSFIQGEQLDERKKTNIMNNISLKADSKYLIYWIYNGRGNFDESLDIAKVLDDTQLIMYSLIKKIEQVKNDTTLSGNEKMDQQTKYQEELNKYKELFAEGEKAEEKK